MDKLEQFANRSPLRLPIPASPTPHRANQLQPVYTKPRPTT